MICARDAAYHRGTVWGWLIGPFVDACVGSVSEVSDAEPTFTRGCIARAWSGAEVLRCLVKTAR